ncbi:hypothetical protein D3C72_1659780 [compost metagenome]
MVELQVLHQLVDKGRLKVAKGGVLRPDQPQRGSGVYRRQQLRVDGLASLVPVDERDIGSAGLLKAVQEKAGLGFFHGVYGCEQGLAVHGAASPLLKDKGRQRRVQSPLAPFVQPFVSQL